MARKAELLKLHKELGTLINAYEEPEDLSSLATQHANSIDRSEIVAKINTMHDVLQDPADLASAVTARLTELPILRVAHSVSLFDHVPESPATISTNELAKATKLQPAVVRRIVRYLIAMGYLAQSSSDPTQISLNRRSVGWRQANIGAWFQFVFDVILSPLTKLHLFLQDDSMKPHYEPGHEPSNPAWVPVTYANGVNGTHIWQWLFSQPHLAALAQKAFSVMDEGSNPIVGGFNWDSLDEGSSDVKDDRLWLVDVGGGIGQTIKRIMDAFPNLAKRQEKFMLQDLESSINASRHAGVLPENSKALAHDFFTPQPPQARGAKVYLLQRVIHDWSDELSVAILKNVANAMSSDSILLIADSVVPEVVKEKDTQLFTTDALMLAIGGKERTEKEWEALFDQAGLELVKIWRHDPRSGLGTTVEGKLKR